MFQRSIPFLCGLLLFVLCACGSGASSTDRQPAAITPQPDPTPPPALAALSGRVSPCAVVEKPIAIDSSGVIQAAAENGTSKLNVTYDGDINTIVLRQETTTTLAGVSRALNRPDLLRELAPGEWLLAANLELHKGSALRIAAPEVRWLKLHSDGERFVAIRAVGGQVEFTDTCVSSWDPQLNSYDKKFTDGRSFVLARDGSRMVIRGSELRYLGYNEDESFGVAWRTPGTTGEIVNSYLAYNYFGLYTYEVSDLVIRGNEVHHNVLYGLDPHTRSLRLVIEDNVVHHNGKHGIILADACSDGVIRNNVVYHNLHHGIVLYQHSNNNLVEGNIVYGNGAEGININGSSGNVLRNNTLYDNLDAGVGVGQDARANQLMSNHIYTNREDGIALYGDAMDTTVRSNIVRDNQRHGIYVKTIGAVQIEENHVFGNTIGVYLNAEPPPPISRESNRIEHNREADLRIAGP